MSVIAQYFKVNIISNTSFAKNIPNNHLINRYFLHNSRTLHYDNILYLFEYLYVTNWQYFCGVIVIVTKIVFHLDFWQKSYTFAV